MVASREGRKGRGEVNGGEREGKVGVSVYVRTYVCADMCDTLCM